jgi:DNA-binding SARP family transcriptional activator
LASTLGLDVRLLGPPAITVDGRPLDVDTRKAIAILACLVLESGPVRRDWLAALLWPESDDEHARSALRRTLSTLNRALGGRWLDVQRDRVALSTTDGCEVDVADVREGIRSGRAGEAAGFERAIESYGGELLAGFSLRDSAEFEQWVEPITEELRRDFVLALERTVEARCAVGRYDDGEQLAARWLAADPLNEAAYRWLMKAAAWRGDRSAALARYRDCVRVLDAELGVPPLDETTDLYLAIRSGTLTQPDADTTRDTQPADALEALERPTPRRGPIVGRDGELHRLQALGQASNASPRIVVVEGEAGVGKTRLLDEFCAGAGPVLRASCYPGEAALAYGPVRELIEVATRERGLGGATPEAVVEAARLVPSLASDRTPGPLDSPGAQVRFFAGVAEVLAVGGGDVGRQTIVIDDAQWLDSASADLLAFLLRRLEQYPVTVVLAVRPEDIEPGARTLLHAIRPLPVARILLGRLERSAISAWVRGVLGNEPPSELVARVSEESEGLPLLVAEYLASLESGPPGADRWTLPAPAREVLGARLQSLSGLDQQVLATAAALGRPFAFETVRDASGRTEEEVLGAFERLLARRFLLERGEPRVAPQWEFAHEKLRQLAYDSMSATRRRVVHRRLADTLKNDGSPAEVAAHLALAGHELEAAAQYFAAGQEARRLYANREALDYFASALALGHPEPAQVHAAAGDVGAVLGDFEGALRSYEMAAALSEEDALRRLEHTLGRLYVRLGEFEQAEDRFRSALASPAKLRPDQQALILADWSLLAFRRDESERAGELAREAVAVAETAGSSLALSRARIALGIIARREARLEEARDALDQALGAAEELDAPDLIASALNALALTYGDLGDGAGAIALAQRALALCEAQGDRQRAAAVHSNLADLHHAIGEEDLAMTHLERSAALFGEIGVVAGTPRPEVWKLVDW